MKRWRVAATLVIAAVVLSGLGGFLFLRGSFNAPPNQLVLGADHAEIPFSWQSADFDGSIEPHAAMLLPVAIPGTARQFHMQFDLGAPYSLFYRASVDTILAHCDECLPLRTDDDGRANLESFLFTVGDLPVTARQIRVRRFDDTDIDWNRPGDVAVIGTLGADLVDGRIAIIDYPGGTVSLDIEMPESLNGQVPMAPMQFTERRVMFPAVVAGQETTLLFDTGSSAFALLTDQGTWNRLRRVDSTEEVFPVSSWDDTLTAHRVATDTVAQLGGMEIPLGNVTYIEDTSLMQNLLMRFSGMGGMIGNRLFLDKRLVMDLRRERFVVLKAAAGS